MHPRPNQSSFERVLICYDTDVTAFETEKPLIFSLEVIEEATLKFDETRKIGEGGYGSVYYGMLGEQV